MSTASFPLLKKLTEAGDPFARKVFKEEIAQRLESGFLKGYQSPALRYYSRYSSTLEKFGFFPEVNFRIMLQRYKGVYRVTLSE